MWTEIKPFTMLLSFTLGDGGPHILLQVSCKFFEVNRLK